MPTPFDVANVAATDGSRPQRRSSAARRTLVALVPVWLFSLAAGGCTRSAGTSPSSSAGRGAPPPLPSGGNRAAEPSPLAATPWSDGGVKPCTAGSAPSLRIRVQDAFTGASICDASVVGSLGTVHEPLTCSGGFDCRCVGFGEKLGTFQVTVTKPGYRSATTTVVVDKSTGCHVVTKDATVKIRRFANTRPVR